MRERSLVGTDVVSISCALCTEFASNIAKKRKAVLPQWLYGVRK